MNRVILSGLGLLMVAACGGGAPADDEPEKSEASSQNAAKTDDAAAPEPVVTEPEPAPPAVVETAAAPITPEVAFRPCAVCHTVADPETPKGQIQLAGPNLFGVYGAPVARRENFAYSKAMRESGVVWNDASLDAYIKQPSKFIRGNRMAFVGERSQEKRAAIIAYLKEQK